MSLTARIIRAPLPVDHDRASEALAVLGDLPDAARDLIRGVAGCSPYLKHLIESNADWLRTVLDDPPEGTLDDLLDAARQAPDADLPGALRLAKARTALLAGLCDCGGVWHLEAVTGALTRLADLASDRAWRREIDVEIARKRLPGTTRDAGGFVALAMGKMGAFELNYSSDIDLICLFDETAYDAADVAQARAALVKASQRACQVLGQTNAQGYVFRTDLRLRPDPSVTPVCMGMLAAERYYESLGRTWERAAHIKARPCAGDLAAGETYLEGLRPFVWRRHLDYAAIQDAHDMRLRIRDHKGLGGPIRLQGHNMKLGRGGIREIEFFTQTRQIIAGGRDPSLRVRGTVEGLSRLADANWIERDVADTLTVAYRAHREVEHRIQMVADRQTHDLPDDSDGMARIAAFMGQDLSDFQRETRDRLEEVSRLTEDFFAPTARKTATPKLTPDQARIVEGWRAVPALRSERALDIFDRIKPALLDRLLSGARPDQALIHFDGFLRGLPAGVQLFSLFEAKPELLSLIADMAGTTQEMASYLSRNAAVLDAVIGGSFFADWPGAAALEADLARRLAQADDYERRLDAARRWARDHHFRIGVHHLRGLVDGAQAGAQYADLAYAVLRALWPVVVDHFAAKHGDPPGRGAMILGMGSLGIGHLTARSDLDLIVIYDADGAEASDGRRPLPARTYYARLTQAVVTALSAPTAEGRLYEVDMRLRPSGKQGPVATPLAGFAEYQRAEAWTWEHLALTRGRAIVGPRDVMADVDAVRAGVIATAHDIVQVRADTATMIDRLRSAKGAEAWDAKVGAGGLSEIELVAAMLGLLARSDARDPVAQIKAGAAQGLISDDANQDLCDAHGGLSEIQSAIRLLSATAIAPAELGASGEALLLRAAGTEHMSGVTGRMKALSAQAATIIAKVLDEAD